MAAIAHKRQQQAARRCAVPASELSKSGNLLRETARTLRRCSLVSTPPH